MSNEQKNTGLAPVRTARLIASLFALMGMVFLLLERVLSAVLAMAGESRSGLRVTTTSPVVLPRRIFPKTRNSSAC